MKFEKIEVYAYSGYKSNERPKSFRLRGKVCNIVEIIDRWYEGSMDPPGYHMNYFKVKTDDGTQYVLRYNGLFDVWSIMTGD
jgi:hypothetical protein